eukprot:6491288-Amphidinium_carterae.4
MEHHRVTDLLGPACILTLGARCLGQKGITDLLVPACILTSLVCINVGCSKTVNLTAHSLDTVCVDVCIEVDVAVPASLVVFSASRVQSAMMFEICSPSTSFMQRGVQESQTDIENAELCAECFSACSCADSFALTKSATTSISFLSLSTCASIALFESSSGSPFGPCPTTCCHLCIYLFLC